MPIRRHAVLRHDADLLRERRAAHRARLHDGRGRRPGPVAAALGRRRRLPHRHRRARAQDPAGGRGARRHARRSWSTATAARFRDDVGRPRHHLRRLHPHHRAPPRRGGAGVPPALYDSGDIELGTYEGLYCVALRGCTTPRTSSSTATARSTAGRSSTSPRRTTSSGSRATRTACSRTTPSIPRRCSPRPAQRGARVHQAGPARLLDQPHVDLRGACRCRGTRSTSRTCGSTRCSTTAPRSATATDRERFDRYWPADYHLSARTSCGSTRCTGPRC